jgi:hypothetical protein
VAEFAVEEKLGSTPLRSGCRAFGQARNRVDLFQHLQEKIDVIRVIPDGSDDHRKSILPVLFPIIGILAYDIPIYRGEKWMEIKDKLAFLAIFGLLVPWSLQEANP